MKLGTFLLWDEVFSTQGIYSDPAKMQGAPDVNNGRHQRHISSTLPSCLEEMEKDTTHCINCALSKRTLLE